MSLASAKRDIRAALSEVQEKKAKLEGEESALQTALNALTGRTNGRTPPRGRGPSKRPRRTRAENAKIVGDFLRHNDGAKFTLRELQERCDLASSSTSLALTDLAESGDAQKYHHAGQDDRWTFKPTVVIPGEGVRE